ncbi:telomere repeats-binding bouquet formation protein 1 [Cynoglossus semilaevis]|uniref:Telomere repeat binding bouquet formation protein 1 n=1 Tax=Cynoglossus semilaevis TaxID=244447 RepID=A0A3P8V7K2_CYNSE|nr:telomere repeats-binding bouquet formation protein 1 [Cynoglossus semilaevis]
MDKNEAYDKRPNTTRTDLSMLLECLKFQMKCPELQKQALLTIQSICENREDNVDLLREIGGVAFVYNLFKSSVVHADVKETALFTLGTLAEANVFCKTSLCKKETFADLAGWLTKKDISLTQRRVAVYLLSVLVANNKSGQSLALTSGCMNGLLELFRTTFPLPVDTSAVVDYDAHTHPLWASVSNGLCGCVNNPQNEDAQLICVATFPILKIWLKEALTHLEIFKTICSFIAMTVANNTSVQESFRTSGCLETITLLLLQLVPDAQTSLVPCQLSATISKTLSACISENSALASDLAQYDIVSKLLLLLASPNLNPEDTLSVLLTLSYCTESSEEHQFQLVKCGGLGLIINLLTEDHSEEVRKATTFILQNCKQATMLLAEPTLTSGITEDIKAEPLISMESMKSSAVDVLYRINQLERKQAKEAEQQDPPATPEKKVLPVPSSVSALHLQPMKRTQTVLSAHTQPSRHKEEDNNTHPPCVKNVAMKEKDGYRKKASSRSGNCKDNAKASKSNGESSVLSNTTALMSSHVKSLDGGREPDIANGQKLTVPESRRQKLSKKIKHADKESQDKKKGHTRTFREEDISLHSRCTGCMLTFEEVTSHTFSSLQSSFHHCCDMHRALQVATDRFRTGLSSLLVGTDGVFQRRPAELDLAAQRR